MSTIDVAEDSGSGDKAKVAFETLDLDMLGEELLIREGFSKEIGRSQVSFSVVDKGECRIHSP